LLDCARLSRRRRRRRRSRGRRRHAGPLRKFDYRTGRGHAARTAHADPLALEKVPAAAFDYAAGRFKRAALFRADAFRPE